MRLPLVEGPLRGSALRRAAHIRGLLASADLAAAVLTLVAIDALYPDASLVTPETLALCPAILLLARILGLYHKDEVRLRQTSLDDAPALFQLATLYALGIWLTRHATVEGGLSGAHVMTVLVGFFAAALCLRSAGRGLARRVLSPERCLVVGEVGTAQRLARALRAAAHNARVVASIECDSAKAEQMTFSDLSHADSLTRVVEAERVERLVVAPRYPDIGHVLSLVHTAKSIGVRVTLVPFLGEIVGASAELESVGGVSMLGIPQLDLSRSARFIKRGVDLIGAWVVLIVASPFVTIVAAAIKVDSPGPVLFRQVRTGRDGTRFQILKFRTMVDGADLKKVQLTARNEAVGLFKIAEDPRVTRVGRLLRKASLDELPQLWNVIRGDMSLVGPRPLIEDEDAKVVGWFRHRLRLQPGMTGPWQVLGSARIPLDDMIRIDYLYVANWSLWGDIKILLQTIPYVLLGRGM
ncbi:MAG TPA: exopolysaccharide biosynthesis polyprenyl glycosylphosphotransferase [Solirubrobacteraceae bacterium]|nr:exopolysaccharide biosynthesis polyprenyl glycosylphosphotransferase [Solirubrobacteraceae bacterium]